MPLNPFINRDTPILEIGTQYPMTLVKERSFGKYHCVFSGAPDEWARDRGATHTLAIGKKDIGGGGTRPAKLLKTRLYVGVDETDSGDIEWERWETCIWSVLPDATYRNPRTEIY